MNLDYKSSIKNQGTYVNLIPFWSEKFEVGWKLLRIWFDYKREENI